MFHFLFEMVRIKHIKKCSSNADWFIEIVSVNQQKQMKNLYYLCVYVFIYFYPFLVSNSIYKTSA